MLVLAACGGSGDEAESEGTGAEGGGSTESGATGEVTVWKFGSPQAERDYLLDQTEAFEEQSGVTVSTEFFDWEERHQRVALAESGDGLPDVLLIENSMVPDLAEEGVLTPLGELEGADPDAWLSDFAPALAELGAYEDSMYGFSPYVDLSPVLVYNREIFEAEGIEAPQSWDEVAEVAERLTTDDRSGVVFGADLSTLNIDILESLIYQNGGRWFDDAGEVVIDGPGTVDTLAFMQRLSEFAPRGLTEFGFRDALQLFHQEEAAMVITKSFSPIIREDTGVPEDFPGEIVQFPTPSNVAGDAESASFVAQAPFLFTVTRQVGDEAATSQYLEFWAQSEQHEGWDGSAIVGRVPSAETLLAGEGFATQYTGLSQQYEAGDLFETVVPIPAFPGHAEAAQELGAAFQAVLLGAASPEEALQGVSASVTAS
jgi:ABC-type glycerol-3-phosphate transport system substrate-binding protein